VSVVWINGRLVDAADAVVPFDDHGITVGDGAFETIRLRDGRPFALTRHLTRLAHSLVAMALPAVDLPVVAKAVNDVGLAQGGDGYVRVTVTGGRAPLGSPRGDSPPTVIVAFRPGELRTEPAAVAVVPFTRNDRGALAGVKSTSYAENVIALAHATALGAEEAIFANTAGNLCEGTGSNVFVEVGGRLVTPPLSAGCLAGVTRALVLELVAGVAGVDVEELDVPIDTLASTSEAFLVSTGREVQPIRWVDGLSLPDCPGPLTRAARSAWLSRFGPDCPPDRLDP
jgi:branched-chain amino acid aminotransferase